MADKRDEQISSLETKLQQLKAREARVHARRSALAGRKTRREETRRKVLVGAVVLAKVEAGDIHEKTLRGWMDGALEREEDRALFGLGTGK